MGIAVLGPLLVDDRAVLSPRDQVVLEALVAAGGTALSAESLAEALWGEAPPASWRKLVPSSILRIRKVLGTGAIETTSHGYRLAAHGDTVDAVRFVHLVERGHHLLTVGDPDRARHVLREALGLWRGRRSGRDPRLGAGPVRGGAARRGAPRGRGGPAGRQPPGRSARRDRRRGSQQGAQEPLRERRWALLALAQYLAGDQADALETLRGGAAPAGRGARPGPRRRDRTAGGRHPAPGRLTRRRRGAAGPRPGVSLPGTARLRGRGRRGLLRPERRARPVPLPADRAGGARRRRPFRAVASPRWSARVSSRRSGATTSRWRSSARVPTRSPGCATSSRRAGGVSLVVDQLEEVLAACGPEARASSSTVSSGTPAGARSS